MDDPCAANMHAKLAFRIPHFTHRSAADFRTVHSEFYFPHSAFCSSAFYWYPRISKKWASPYSVLVTVCVNMDLCVNKSLVLVVDRRSTVKD